MTDRPTRLCTLALRHDYFADGLCRKLLPRPSPRTATRLRALGWHARCERGWLELWGPQEARLADEPPLLFWLHNDDPYLANYTVGAGPAGPGVWYFDDAGGGPVLSARDGVSAMARVDTGAQRQPAALDGAVARELVLCGPPPPSVWGVVALRCLLPELRLELRSRATRWRYRVTAPAEAMADLKRGSVTGSAGGREIAFHGPAIGGAEPGAAVFTALSPLPLRERPEGIDVRLHIPSATAGWARELRLAYAQGSSLAIPARDGSGDYFSDIQVHL